MSSRTIALWVTALIACNSEPTPPENTPVSESEASSEVRLDEAQSRRADLKVGALQRRELGNPIQTNGYLEVPPSYRASVSPMMVGYVKRTTLLVGDQVREGQTLVTLSHPDYVSLQQQYLETTQQLDYLKAEYERQVALDQDRINSKKNLQKATADYQSAQAREAGLRQQLLMLGINPDQVVQGTISSEIRLRSPINGYVTRVNSTLGKLAHPDDVLFEIVNLDHLHAEIEVFESDIPKLRVGQPFTFSVGGTDETYSGTIHLIGKSLEGEERTVHVHGHLQEHLPHFLPGMYISATISSDADSVWSLPEAAVVQEEGQAYVFVKQSGVDFAKVAVQTGRAAGGWVEIAPSDDLQTRDSVVVEGAYFLSAASGSEEQSHDH